MNWWSLLLLILLGIAGLSLALYWLVRWLGRREPYRTFLALRTRRKLTFFRVLLGDQSRRIPFYVKLIPFLLIGYLALPFDLIPDFVPILGYLDDVAIVLLALVLIIRFTPPDIVRDALRQAGEDSPG